MTVKLQITLVYDKTFFFLLEVVGKWFVVFRSNRQSFWDFQCMQTQQALISCYTELEMSICGTLVSSEWSRLAIFKEVTTTVRQLMAHVFFLGQKQNQTYQNTMKKYKKKKRNVSFAYSRCTHAHFLCMCMCVCVCWRWGIGLEGPTKWALIQDHWSGPSGPYIFNHILKGKTYRGSAPILCCCSSSGTKNIQINTMSQSRQLDCSLAFFDLSPWHIKWGGVERYAFSVGLSTCASSPQAGVRRIQSLTELCLHVHVCVQ